MFIIVVFHHFVDNKYNYFSIDFSISYGVFPLNDPCDLLKFSWCFPGD